MLEGGLLFADLTYRLIGLSYKLFNEVGYGMPEKFYQQGLEKLLTTENIPFKREQLVKLTFSNSSLGKYFLDFVVDEKVVMELKVKPRLGYTDIHQVTGYLKSTGYQLALLIYFTKDGVKYRRIIRSN